MSPSTRDGLSLEFTLIGIVIKKIGAILKWSVEIVRYRELGVESNYGV